MSTYTLDFLRTRGPKFAFGLLIQHIGEGEEPFVTYRQIAVVLERELKIPQIFSTHIGAVAGALMDRIHDIAPDAPLINGLITRPTGIPGKGFGGYYDNQLRHSGGRYWETMSRAQKIAVVGDVRQSVRDYRGWHDIYVELFNSQPNKEPKKFTEEDGKPPEKGGREGGEGKLHYDLKIWVRDHPEFLGLPKPMHDSGREEIGLLSGDRIDVVFTDGKDFAVVEVKSSKSSYDDLQRGIYQCVKYRAVMEAQQFPVGTIVRAFLVTEEELPATLKTRAGELNVDVRVRA